MDNRVLYHKKFGKVEITISKTTRRGKLQALMGFTLLALVIWYVTWSL